TSDPNLDTEDASDSTALTEPANLSIPKTCPDTVLRGTSMTCTIVVRNAGPASAAVVQVVDPTPEGLAFLSNAGDCATAFPCSVGPLDPGATRTILASYAVESTAPDLVVNSADVMSPTADPNPADNTSATMTAVESVPVIPPTADLEVRKTGPASAAPGTEVTYVIGVVNHGPDSAANVVLTDALPAGVTLVPPTSISGPSPGGPRVPGSLGPRAGGRPAVTVLVTVEISPPASGSLVDTATATSSTSDPVAANNTATAQTSVVAHADL